MTVLRELVAGAADLSDDALEHLQLLLADWQILADLSFADLLLFVRARPNGGMPGYLCIGQMRPYTAQTIYAEDLLGERFSVGSRPMIGRAFAECRVIRDADPDWSTGVPVREEAIPVLFRDEVIAVVSREANVSTARSPSQLELTYLQSAGELAQMLAEGTFPYEPTAGDSTGLTVRVGDGIVRLAADGQAGYASPNAISAYRRLGSLGQVIGRNLTDFDPECGVLLTALSERRSTEHEVERHGTAILRRLLPIILGGEVRGGLLIVREVTDLRRHQRQLRIKDATIREIHHRVKNNLQTVASLLRLQSRRMETSEAREALDESVRRISSIALVHETLSEETSEGVRLAPIAQRITEMLADGLGNPEAPIKISVEGDAGELPAEVATPLALVLTELLQNSLEHAFPVDRHEPGHLRLRFERDPATLRMLVADDGVGLPKGESLESMAHLGLRIARTLVESELGGTFRTLDQSNGTTFELVVPLP
jgi:two-component system, sensor histidine kinase PdtaS